MRRVLSVALGTLALAIASASHAPVRAAVQGMTTNDGIYTAAQATSGKEVYGQLCESCHQPSKFLGSEFTRAFGEKPLSELDAAMSGMPMDNPGSLKREEIAQLIAFFLSMNKYPAGEKTLSGEADALKGIMVAPRK